MPPKDPEARKAYMRAYYLANRERIIANAKAWNAANPERAREIARKWYANRGKAYRAAHPEQEAAKQARWYASHRDQNATKNRTYRLRRYGLTHAEYDAMIARQNGLCAICQRPETHRGRNGEVTRMAIDHDHVTGSIRALLCHSCNTGLGSFYDDPARLRAAAEYVESYITG